MTLAEMKLVYTDHDLPLGCTNITLIAEDLLRGDIISCRGGSWEPLRNALQGVLQSRQIDDAQLSDKTTSKAILSTISGANDTCAFTTQLPNLNHNDLICNI